MYPRICSNESKIAFFFHMNSTFLSKRNTQYWLGIMYLYIRAYTHTCIVLMVWRIILCWSVTERNPIQFQILALKFRNPICKCFKGVKPKNVNFEKQLLAWGANVTAKLWWKWSEYINNFWQDKGVKLMLVKMDFRSFLVSICDHEYKTQRDEKSN